MNSFLFFSSVACLLHQFLLLPPMETPAAAASSAAAAAELPADLVAEILKRLPIKSLLRFKSVSHQWHLLIDSPTFVSRLLRRSIAADRSLLVRRRCRSSGDRLLSMLSSETLDLVSPVDVPPDMHSLNADIVGSCNGVVCLSHDSASDSGSSIFLWNPATRQHRTLPSCIIARESLEFPGKPCVVVHGFGYHRAADDYKVVRIAFDYPPHRPCFRAEVFALREGSWKEVNALPCRVYSPGCVAVNGILYWVAYNCGSNDDVELILSFDLRDEVFRRICMPDLDFRPDGTCTKLAVYEDSLCLIAYNFKGRAKCLDFWLMSGEAGKETWMRRLSIGPVIGIRRPLGFGGKGEILVEKTNGMLGIYEESCEEIRELPVKGFPYSLDIHSYIESMVPVKTRSLLVNFRGQG